MIVIRNCECDRSFEVILTEVPFEPHVVNPLSVDTRPSGKKRLIRDLRHVNKFLLNEHIKFDDWRIFQHFVRPGGFISKFLGRAIITSVWLQSIRHILGFPGK